jgi:ABC-type sugar transport system permease subunit
MAVSVDERAGTGRGADRALVPPRPRSLGAWWRRHERRLAPYLFVAPFFVLFAVFMAYPVANALWLSLHEWTGLGAMEWVGWDNYGEVLRDASFHHAAANTAWYAAASLFVICPLALLLALALNSRRVAAKDLLRTGYFIPVVLSPVVIALMFTIIFDQEFGLMNAGLRGLLGIRPINWLGSPEWARLVIIIILVWRWTGYIMIYFLAGLQNIPRELYEAAQLDGAGSWRLFWNITLPLLRPVTAFVAVVVLIGASQIFEEPYILTNGGPGEATLSIANYVQREGFERLNFGYAATASFILFAFVFLVTQVQIRFFGIGREQEG